LLNADGFGKGGCRTRRWCGARVMIGGASSPARGHSTGRLIAAVLLTALLSAAITAAAFYFYLDRLVSEITGLEGFTNFMRVYRLIQDEYVEEVDGGVLMQGAAAGMVEALGDPYSHFMGAEAWEEMKIHTSGHYEGVGIQVVERDGYVVIVAPIKGTPGAEAGFRPGDKIVAVDGKDIVGLPVDQVVRLIRGPAGTEVTLTVLRGEEQLDITVVRAAIDVPTVEHRMMDEAVGYLAITQFNEQTDEEVPAAVEELREAGMRGLILDLRYNPGGLLDEALRVAEFFLPPGPIVHVVDGEGNERTYSSSTPGVDFPIVVLVNEGSASASEILAGALRDRGLAVLVGTTTFGKGSVQKLHRLPDGSGVRLTTAKWFTPLKHPIDEEGLAPDVVVEAGEGTEFPGHAATDPARDPQLRKAIEVLREKLGL